MPVLVAAPSQLARTREVCLEIGRVLAETGLEVEVRALQDVDAIDGYEAVVIGSAVENGRWQREARRFIERHGYVLRLRPVWLFSSDSLSEPPAQPEEPDDATELAVLARARDHVVFVGRLAGRLPGVSERSTVRVIRTPTGISREWSQVDEWARRIAGELRRAA